MSSGSHRGRRGDRDIHRNDGLELGKAGNGSELFYRHCLWWRGGGRNCSLDAHPDHTKETNAILLVRLTTRSIED